MRASGRQSGLAGFVTRVLLYAAAGLAVLLPVLMALAPLASSETFLHLEAGERIAGEGPRPEGETLLHVADPSAPFFPSWLGDLLLHRTWEAWGVTGLRLLAGLLAACVMGLLVAGLSVHSPGLLHTVAGLALADLVLIPFLHPLPVLMALPLLVLGFQFLGTGRRPVPAFRIAALFLLTALAVNLAPEAAIGFVALYALFVGSRLLFALYVRSGEGPDPRWTVSHLCGIGVSALALLANPWHLHLPILLWQRTIFWSDLLPDRTFLSPLGPGAGLASMAGAAGVLVILGLNLAAILLGHRAHQERGVASGTLIASAAAAAGALLSARHLWLLLLPLTAGLRRDAPMSAPAVSEAKRGRPLLRYAALIFGLGLALLAVLMEPRVQDTWNRVAVLENYLEPVDPDALPVDAARFLGESEMEGPVFVEPGWGGYLAHALPRSTVFLDERLGQVPEHVRNATAGILSGGEESGRLLEDYGVSLAVVRADRHPPGRPGEWARIFRNRMAAVYLLRSPGTLEMFVRTSRYYRNHGIPQSVAERFEEAVVLEANPDWAVEFRLLDEAVAGQVLRLYREIRQTPDREEWVALLRRLGNTYARLGLYDSALREWTRGLQLSQRDRNLLYNTGVAQMRLQRLEDARLTFQTYHVLYPEDEQVERILGALDQVLSF